MLSSDALSSVAYATEEIMRVLLLAGTVALSASLGIGAVLVILRAPAQKAAALVASYIGAAYWFTSSTSFANPAAVFGRMFSDTFAGIAPSNAVGFVAAELTGAAIGVLVYRLLR